MSRLLLIFVLFFTLSKSYSQKMIDGIVADSISHMPVNAAIVQIMDSLERIVNYGFTDTLGYFRIKIEKPVQKIVVTSIGYQKKILELKETSLNNVRIELAPAPKELQEVIIKSFIPRDTVSIQFDSSLYTKNATLNDILKNNDQLSIGENGEIVYRGRKINKILVNKKEVFVNQNSIALQNITNEMIKKLDIITNYRDRYDVNFENFKEVVINVDTKDGFKGKVVNSLQIGAGYNKKYEALHRLFYFSPGVNVFAVNFSNNMGIRQNLENNFFLKYQYGRSDYYTSYLQKILGTNQNSIKDIAHSFVGGIKKENPKTKYNFNYIAQLSKVSHQSEMRTYLFKNDTINQSQLIRGNGNFFYADFQVVTLLKTNVSLTNTFSSNTSFYSDVEKYQNPKSLLNYNLDNKSSLLEYSGTLDWRLGEKYFWRTRVSMLSEINNENYNWDVDTGFYASVKYKLINQTLFGESSVNRRFSSLLNSKLVLNAQIKRFDIPSLEYRADYNYYSLGFSGNGQNRRLNYFLTLLGDIYRPRAGVNKISLNLQSEAQYLIFRNTNLSGNLNWKNLPNIFSPYVQNYQVNSNYYIIHLPTVFSFYQSMDGSIQAVYQNIFSGYFGGGTYSGSKNKNYFQLQPEWTGNNYFFTPEKLNIYKNSKLLFYFKKYFNITRQNLLKAGATYSHSKFDAEFINPDLGNLLQNGNNFTISLSDEIPKGILRKISFQYNKSRSHYDIIQTSSASKVESFFLNNDGFTTNISGKYKRMEFSTSFAFKSQKTNQMKSSNTNLKFDIFYNTRKNLSLYLKANNLISLFNNKNFVLMTYYNGSSMIEIKEFRLLGYGVIGAQIRF